MSELVQSFGYPFDELREREEENMQQLTPQEASYLATLVSLDISRDLQDAKPLAEIQEKQKTLARLRLLAGEEEKRVSEDIQRSFQEFRRQALFDTYS